MTDNFNKLRHPNVMTTAQRLALPDPCRPIDHSVMPARYALDFLPVKKRLPIHQADMMDSLPSASTLNVRQFIDQQQQYVHTSSTKQQILHLPLSLLPRLVNDSSLSLLKAVIRQYPHLTIMKAMSSSNCTQSAAIVHPTVCRNDEQIADCEQPSHQKTDLSHNALLNIEAKLYLMGQMYHIMLCVFLLCQCKSRKSLNPHITLQDLTDAINQYGEAHRTELYFLTQQSDMQISPAHIELAMMAMDWQISKHTDITKRTANISSQNPLTGVKM